MNTPIRYGLSHFDSLKAIMFLSGNVGASVRYCLGSRKSPYKKTRLRVAKTLLAVSRFWNSELSS